MTAQQEPDVLQMFDNALMLLEKAVKDLGNAVSALRDRCDGTGGDHANIDDAD